MIKRFLEKRLKKLSEQYPIVTITGPRQSGKTTLTKSAFPKYRYISLEDPDNRNFAEKDPRGFLNEYSSEVIFDEIQRAPDLFSYLQTAVDKAPIAGRFILTGSQQFLLNEKVSQSLSGRTALLCLLPFSLAELTGRKQQGFWDNNQPTEIPPGQKNIFETMHAGFYPRIHDRNLEPQQWYRDYFETYITKDARSVHDIGDLNAFEQFIRLLAGRSGQILNLTSLGNDSGVSHTTARRWISILETSYIIRLLQPHFKNFNKRLIKSPKIYFLDPGLLCYLLRIPSPKNLPTHPQLGNIFETFATGEVLKWHTHQGLEAPLYYWRDRGGKEIDLILDRGDTLYPIEIKASQTISSGFFENIKQWLALPKNKQTGGALITAGNNFQKRENIQIIPWYGIS